MNWIVNAYRRAFMTEDEIEKDKEEQTRLEKIICNRNLKKKEDEKTRLDKLRQSNESQSNN